ncbi:MAG: hypothetical protein ACYTFW_26920 [Planctomycetota bacterium]|jgi:hypothetical protein
MRIKKILSILIVAMVLTGSTLWAFDPPSGHMNYSSTQTIDASVVTGTGYLYGISCKTDGTNAVTFQIYDNTEWDPPLPFATGVYVDITSSDATPDYVVYYRLK